MLPCIHLCILQLHITCKTAIAMHSLAQRPPHSSTHPSLPGPASNSHVMIHRQSLHAAPRWLARRPTLARTPPHTGLHITHTGLYAFPHWPAQLLTTACTPPHASMHPAVAPTFAWPAATLRRPFSMEVRRSLRRVVTSMSPADSSSICARSVCTAKPEKVRHVATSMSPAHSLVHLRARRPFRSPCPPCTRKKEIVMAWQGTPHMLWW